MNLLLLRAARRVIKSGVYLWGSNTANFERVFSGKYFPGYTGVAVGNGFDALRIILTASEIGPGMNVVVPVLSPLPVWMAVSAVGANVIPAYCDPVTFVMTPQNLPMIPYVHAIIVVHLFGYPADVASIREKAHEMYGNYPLIIEDCCQAHGTRFSNSYVGAQGDAAAFSFYPTKNMGALGDAGLIITADTDLANLCKDIAFYGGGERKGINSRMDEIQAAFLLKKLPYLEKWNRRRRENAIRYLRNLAGLSFVVLPRDHPGHSWHQFVINVKNRESLITYLYDNNVESYVHYYEFAPDVPYYNQSTTMTTYMRNTALSLPIAPHVTLKDVDRISELIRKFDTGAKRNV